MLCSATFIQMKNNLLAKFCLFKCPLKIKAILKKTTTTTATISALSGAAGPKCGLIIKIITPPFWPAAFSLSKTEKLWTPSVQRYTVIIAAAHFVWHKRRKRRNPASIPRLGSTKGSLLQHVSAFNETVVVMHDVLQRHPVLSLCVCEDVHVDVHSVCKQSPPPLQSESKEDLVKSMFTLLTCQLANMLMSARSV